MTKRPPHVIVLLLVSIFGASYAARASAATFDDGPPTRITFELLNTACGTGPSYQFFLNSTSLGTVVGDDRDGNGSADGTCTGLPPIQTFIVSDTSLLASAWNMSGVNNLRMVKTSGYYFSWVRARMDFPAGSLTVYYDVDGGDATDTNLVNAGYTGDPLDVRIGVTFYRDADSDGFGAPSVTTTILSLSPPPGYASTAGDCDDSDPMVPSVTPCPKALIFGPSVVGGTSSEEAQAATALGYTVTVVSESTWSSMTQADFGAYGLLMFGDPNCNTLSPAATANASVWAPVVMGTAGGRTLAGNRILIGTDPVLHDGSLSSARGTIIRDGIAFAGKQPGRTGLYFDASCSGGGGGILTALDLLSTGVGTWTNNPSPPCGGSVSLIASEPSFADLTTASLEGWGCSVHETWPTFPTDWSALAVATDTPSHPTCGVDPNTGVNACGEAYILIAGSSVVVASGSISVSPVVATGKAGGTHTVTAHATSGDTPLASQAITFTVTGQNAAITGACSPTGCVTDSNGDVSFTYVDVNGAGDDTIKASFIDGRGSLQAATAQMHWKGNEAPVAVADLYRVDEDGTVVIPASGVLTNDSDADGDALTAVKVSDPMHGTLALNPNGSFTYTPAANYNGTDSFSYRAQDSEISSDVVVVTIEIAPVNDPPALGPIGNHALVWGDTVSFTATASDVDLPYDALSFSLSGAPANASITADGVFTWTPTDSQVGTHTVTVAVSDRGGLSDVVPVTIDVLKAMPTLSVSGGTFTFDGTAHPATGVVLGLGGVSLGAPVFTYNGSTDAPVNAGTYAVKAFYAGSSSYTEATHTSATIVIRPAAPVITWGPSQFVSAGSMLRARRSHASVVLNDGRVLLAGSENRDQTAELFDPASGTFAYTGNLTTARCYGCGAAKLPDGTVLLAGGWPGGPVLDTAEVYDPATGQFTLLAARMSSNRLDPKVAHLKDSRILFVGGHNGFTPWATAEIFDPASKTFSPTGSMSTGRLPALAMLSDGRVLAAGGMVSGGAYAATAEIYDPGTGTWTNTVGPMTLGRHGHAAVALRDGRVLVTGGIDETSRIATAGAEVFDPATSTFTAVDAMASARVGHRMVLLASGEVLVVGGADATGKVLNTTELFDPITNTFRPGAPLQTARSDAATATLLDGRVLVTGGTGAGGGFLASAELYEPGGLPPVVYGTRLGAGQLNATANVDGTFVYNPAADTLLEVGVHTLHVDFTPNDAANYTSGTATTTLEVLKATPTVAIDDATVTFDGRPHSVPAAATGVRGEALAPVVVTYNGLTDPPVDADIYKVVATHEGDANYTRATDEATLIIEKATPGLTVTGGTFTYDGQPHAATGVVTGVDGAVIGVPVFTYRRLPDGSDLTAAPTAAGVYEAKATFGGSRNYTAASAIATIVINEPPVITSLTGPTGPVAPGTTVTIGAAFTDPATGDAHTCTFAWGDGTADSVIAVPAGATTCQAAHAYTSPAVSAVRVTVTDDDNLSADAVFESVIVSSGTGTVSGGGSVQSPAGAYVADPTLSGTASVTLSVRYAKGATVPSGTTSFTYTPGRLSFSATTYRWLVVSAGRAWYRGTGTVTINGQSQPAEFLVAAVDGANASADMLRMRIWTASGVIYDNQPGAGEGAVAAALMTSGPASLVVR